MAKKQVEGMCLSCKGVETQDWYAWNDLMPPQPDFFHITGEVNVPNPGVTPSLAPAVPQGINPAILLLDLYLVQQPGVWPQVFVWKPARFDKKILRGYTHVEVRCDGKTIATVEVQDIH